MNGLCAFRNGRLTFPQGSILSSSFRFPAGKIPQRCPRQRGVHFPGSRNLFQLSQMLSHHLRIPAHNRPAEGPRRTQLRVVGQGLPQNRHHLPAGFSARKAGRARHLFCRHQQGNQQRRSKRSPGVIGRLPVLRNGKWLRAQSRAQFCRRLAGQRNHPPAQKAHPEAKEPILGQKSSTDVPTPRPRRDGAAPAVRRSRGPRWSAARSCLSTPPAFASCRAARAISRSGTQNQTRSASKGVPGALHRACTRRASARAFRRDAALFPETIALTRYPARWSSSASALPSLPGPTIAMRGLTAIAAA